LRISRQSKAKGYETPKALSSVTMAGEIAAVKNYQKNSPNGRKTENAMKR